MAHLFIGAQQKSYKTTCDEYRNNNLMLLLSFLTFVPAEIVFYGVFDLLFGNSVGKVAMFVGFGVWGAGISRYGSRTKMLHCPRCGQRFFKRGHRHNDFARRCLNCGLPKYATHDPNTLSISASLYRINEMLGFNTS